MLEHNKQLLRPLPAIGKQPSPKELANGLISALRRIQEPVALVVTLHLFTEQWLNLILRKFCLKFDLSNYVYRRKLEIAFGMGKLSEELFFNLGKLNKL